MKCEICKTIERLGLDDSAHDIWHCTDAGLAKTTVRHSRSFFHQIRDGVRAFARSRFPHYRLWTMAAQRRSLVTLGL